jgi:hypothetical protein
MSEENSNKLVFKTYDFVITMKEERDVKIIPAGTTLQLTGKCSVDMWWGHGTINGVFLSLLVNEYNLEHAFK